MDGLWAFLFHLREELLLFSAFWFVIGGLDELAVDLIWLGRTGWRRATRYRHIPPMRARDLPTPLQSGPLILFIAAWQEADVIGYMLRQCEDSWRRSGILYRIYVGCYPNDADTVRAVIAATRSNSNVKLVLCATAGPTTKADCLNRLWAALTSDELSYGYKAKAVILHDAEDYVHPLELGIYDYLIERAAAVQLPVIPMAVPGSMMVSGHYCDEFAEAHGKSLVVREAIGAAVPLAGVGCAIERNRLGRIAIARNGEPFDSNSLTEDYELGLGLGAEGGKVIFARMLDDRGAMVGTRACFPATLEASTRQKARWMLGIALAGWDRLGWRGGVAEYWMRLRDRKALLAAIALSAAYLCIILSVILLLVQHAGVYSAPRSSDTVGLLLLVTLAMLCWRIAMRFYLVRQMHGTKQAWLSIPRMIVANVISIIAARRACWSYIQLLLGGKLRWDKTQHADFPEKVGQHV